MEDVRIVVSAAGGETLARTDLFAEAQPGETRVPDATTIARWHGVDTDAVEVVGQRLENGKRFGSEFQIRDEVVAITRPGQILQLLFG